MTQKTNKNVGHGFQPDTITDENYIFGGYTKLPEEILQPNGQWDEFLPEIEFQERNGLETMNCVVYGTLNALEALFKRLFKREINKSERYIGVMAETTPAGNSPQKVIEIIRKTAGLIDEEILPFDSSINTWKEYYSPDPMTDNFIKIGKKWLQDYSVQHEWVFKPGDKNKQNKLKDALKYSPVGVSVYAWMEDKNGLCYKPAGVEDNHWVMLYGWDKRGWKVFDHYDDTFKKLKFDYDFGFAKRYYLKKNKSEAENKKRSIWEIIKNYFLNLWMTHKTS